jgi:GNAT superfamily N-acetyltransferase
VTWDSLAHLNFAEWLREHARAGAGETCDAGGLVHAAGATRLPAGPFNACTAPGPSPAPADTLARARAWFGARGRGFTVYARVGIDDALIASCRREGLPELGAMPGMVLERAPELRLPEGVTVSSGAAAELVQVSIAAWAPVGIAAPAFHKQFAEPGRLLLPHLHVVVAWRDGCPLATALGLLSHGIAGIYWVGTVPAARGQGLGGAVTAEVARWAFAQGARAVVLQASAQGEPVYRRLGFREISRYVWFVAAAS